MSIKFSCDNQISISALLVGVGLIASAVIGSGAAAKAQGQNAQPEQVSAEVRFIALGMQNALEEFPCVQAKGTLYKFTSKKAFEEMKSIPALASKKFPTQDQERISPFEWFYQKPNLLLQVQTDPKDTSKLRSQHLVVGAKQSRYLQTYEETVGKKESRYHIGNIGLPSAAVNNGVPTKGVEYYDPRSYLYFQFPGGKPLSELLLKNNPPAVYKGEETVEGSQCARVEVWPTKGYQLVFWIDTEHNFMLRRFEEYYHADKIVFLSRRVQVPRLLKSNGSWLPEVIEDKRFLYQREAPQDTEKKAGDPIASIWRLTITEFKADCEMPRGAFDLVWPEGTNVSDQINQKHFVVEKPKKVQDKNDTEGQKTPPAPETKGAKANN